MKELLEAKDKVQLKYGKLYQEAEVDEKYAERGGGKDEKNFMLNSTYRT